MRILAKPRASASGTTPTDVWKLLSGDFQSPKPLRLTRGNGLHGGLEKKSATRRTRKSLEALLDDGWALIAPFAPEYTVLDLDGAATGRVPASLDLLAKTHGGVLAYAALSGSKDSQHRAYLFRTAAGAKAFRAEAIYYAPAGTRIEDRTADQKTVNARRGRGLRLPLSASLKPGGGLVLPIDSDGLPISLTATVEMVLKARETVGLSSTPPAVSTSVTQPRWSQKALADLTTPGLSDALAGFTPADRATLCTHSPVGFRSDTALAALRVIAKRYGQDWNAARGIVMTAPATAKFARRGERAARRWYELSAGRYLAYIAGDRVDQTEADVQHAQAVLEAGYTILRASYDVEAAHRAFIALQAITERLTDGRGSQRVAVRDLMDWGAAPSYGAARAALKRLREVGLLVLLQDYDPSRPLVARRWRLASASELQAMLSQFRGGERNSPGVYTPLPADGFHTGLSALPATSRVIHMVVRSGLTTTRSIAQTLQISTRCVRVHLARLVGAGAVLASGGHWVLDQGFCLSGVPESLAALRVEVRTCRERFAGLISDLSCTVGWMVWHAQSRKVHRPPSELGHAPSPHS